MARKRSSKIGGQAVMEGVMMRGEKSYATAVRNPEGKIVVESRRLPSKTPWWKKVPIVRGAINFFYSLVDGMRTLMRSAEVYGEEEPSEFEKKVAKKLKVSLFDVAIWVGIILGVAMSVFLFIMLPQFILSGIEALFSWTPSVFLKNLIMGLIRMAIFLAYIVLTVFMKDIKRVYMYHGAEHKTIACFESDLPLTVENVKTCTKEHDRCGTTFMFLVMAVSIVFFSLLGVLGLDGNMWARIGLRLALMPVVAGISYEILKALAKFDNVFVRILKKPGVWLQKLTTKEPDDDMIEVAIKAFTTVQEMDENETAPELNFNIDKNFTLALTDIHNKLRKNKACDYEVDAEWLFAHVLGIKRSEVKTLTTIKEDDLKKVKELVERRAKGEPLQYILGSQDFYNVNIKCDKRALIPRFETEYLVDVIVKSDCKKDNILDLCTGSGAIAIALKKACPTSQVLAVDISEKALSLTRENAERNGVEIQTLRSDMFTRIEGGYDIIVSNPPYITKKEMKSLSSDVKSEPQNALYGGIDGLDFYRIIAEKATMHLFDGGKLYLEVGKGQAESVKELLYNYSEVEIIKDLDGVDRIVCATR